MSGLLILLLIPAALPAASAPPATAIVLLTQSMPGQSAAIRQQLEQKVRERFPGKEIRWATLPLADPTLLPPGDQEQLPDLNQVLAELRGQGVSRVAVQSLAVMPGNPGEQELAALKPGAGLKIAVGKALISSLAARQRLLTALANTFTSRQEQAILLVGGGNRHPAATREYLALYTLMLAKFKGSNLYIGTSNALPEMQTALAGLKKSSANAVLIVPLPVFIDGPTPLPLSATLESCKAAVSALKSGKVEIFQEGLGTIDGVLAIYLDHLGAAVESLAPAKPAKGKRGRK